jgi:hypothetical protein
MRNVAISDLTQTEDRWQGRRHQLIRQKRRATGGVMALKRSSSTALNRRVAKQVAHESRATTFILFQIRTTAARNATPPVTSTIGIACHISKVSEN